MARSLDEIRREIAKNQVMKPILTFVPKEELSDIIGKIDEAQLLLDQGLLRESEFNDLFSRARNAYEGTVDHGSIQYRKYDKSRRESVQWREVSKSGYVSEKQGYSFADIRQQIVELLGLSGVESPSPREIFLAPHSEYKALTSLKNIFSTATSSIDIQDDYLFTVNKKTKNIDILYILSPFLETSLNVLCRLHASKNHLPSEELDIRKFLEQYEGSVQIKGWSVAESGSRETHDRFIIIDKKAVYKIGASIKDLGKTQSSISEVIDKGVLKQYINQFEKWWTEASDYTATVK